MVARWYVVRDSLGIQQFLGNGELGSVYWLGGLANPADRITEVKSDMIPLLRLLVLGAFHLGVLRSLRGVSPNDMAE